MCFFLVVPEQVGMLSRVPCHICRFQTFSRPHRRHIVNQSKFCRFWGCGLYLCVTALFLFVLHSIVIRPFPTPQLPDTCHICGFQKSASHTDAVEWMKIDFAVLGFVGYASASLLYFDSLDTVLLYDLLLPHSYPTHVIFVDFICLLPA